MLSALRTSLLLLSHSKICPSVAPTWFRLATPLNLISATTETCVFLYIGWRLLFLHSSAGFGFSYSGLYLNSIVSVLSVFVQFALFCIRTYATKLCESLQPASSWGHQNVPNPFCAHDAPPDPLVGWGGDTLPLPLPSTPSASRSRRLWRLFGLPQLIFRSRAPVILSSNKIQSGDILVLAYPGCPGKWLLNESCSLVSV